MSLKPEGHGGPIHQIHRWAIDHERSVIAAYLAVVLFATFAVLFLIPRRFAPYIKSPLLAVVTNDMGRNSLDIEQKITNPTEEILQHVAGYRYMRSTSQDGRSSVTLEFPYGVDIAEKEQQVEAMLPLIESKLPKDDSGLRLPYVTPVDPLNLPILELAITPRPGSHANLTNLRTFCDNELRNRLKDIPSVSSVAVFGGNQRQIKVEVNLQKLRTLGLSLDDVRNALDSYRLIGSAGSLIDGPNEVLIGTNQPTLTAQDVAKIPVVSRGNPPFTVTIGEVAQVRSGVWQQRSAYEALFHQVGQSAEESPAILVAITQDPGESSAKVVPLVMAQVQKLQQENPIFHVQTAYDNAHFVNILYRNVWEELLTAIVLTGIAILLFLGDLRAAFISLFTLPTSLAIAFLLMVPFHFSLNSGTLIGLLLAVGRLVDDTIIDVHNVQRWIGLGYSRREATIQGIAEVRTSVISSTIMIVIALVPLTLAGGLVGQMFYQLVWPLVFGLLASMLVSFTLTPILANRFLSASPAASRRVWGLGTLQTKLERLDSHYKKGLLWCLQNRFVCIALVLSTIVIGATFYNFIGGEMMPLADTGSASARIEMAPGSSFADLQRGVHQIEGIVARYPEVEKASIEMGEEPFAEDWNSNVTGYQMTQTNEATMMLTLSDKAERSRSIWTIIDAIQREAKLTVPGLRLFQIKEMGSDVMASPDSPVTLDAYGPHFQTLDSIGNEMMAVANHMPDELYQPARSWVLGRPEFQVHIDPIRASQVGVSVQSALDQLSAATSGMLSSESSYQGTEIPTTVVVRAQADQRETFSDLRQLPIVNPSGASVPLGAISQITLGRSPTLIQHDGRRRVIQLSAYYRKGHAPSMNAIMDWIQNSYGGMPIQGVKSVNFPPGYGLLVRGDMTQMMESVSRLMGSFLVSLVLMYFVLVIQFKGFMNPLKMIASLPLELSGVFIALWLAHASFSTVSLLGIIVLTGMDITAAVLMIDLLATTTQSARQGSGDQLPRAELYRITAEACAIRLRPILMTASLTIIVLLPVAIAPKTGLDAYQPLAVAVIGGLAVGTILSLFVIPVLHTLIEDLTHWATARWKARFG